MIKRGIGVLIVILMLAMCIQVLPMNVTVVDAGTVRQVDMPRLTAAYTPHAPITITSNADFSTQGWPGSGTVDDPYVIEGLNITSDGNVSQSLERMHTL